MNVKLNPNTSQDEFFMSLALAQAKVAQDLGEVPVGCVIIDNQQQIIATGYNQTIRNCDCTAHAEIIALRQAGVNLNNYRLPQLCMYVTLEPCVMCVGALIHSRIQRLCYGARDYKTGACGSRFSIAMDQCHNHHFAIVPDVLGTPCSELLSNFFKRRRQEQRLQKAALI